MNTPISVGIFEDQSFFAKGLVDFLQQSQHYITICFTAGSKSELDEKLKAERPDILVMDVLAPDVTGLELFLNIIKKYSDLKIIAYTSLKSEILVENLLSLGVKGYVNKNQVPADLVQALREVYYGHISVPANYRHLVQDDQAPVKYIFTNRELQIMSMMSKGSTSAEIATELDISLRTVENLKMNLFNKLDVKNAAELMIAATRLGYVS